MIIIRMTGMDFSKNKTRPENVKVTDVGGIPVTKVYAGFAGTDIESIDLTMTNLKKLVTLTTVYITTYYTAE